MSNAKNIYSKAGRFLSPLGTLYGQVMKARRAFYRNGLISSYRPKCPTVAVGNISWGGTGKTPVTAWLLGWAKKNELKAVVLTRGYKGKPPTLPFTVTPGGNPAQSGDEPLMLANFFPGASVLVDPKRARAAHFAEKTLAPDLLIMDDGFQHLGLARDLNVLLLTPEDLNTGWNKVIPGGTWREEETALKAADVVFIRCDGGTAGEELADLLSIACKKLANIPVFPFYFTNTGLRRLGSAEIAPDLGGVPYNLFCGVGSPDGVLAGATELVGQAPQKFTAFADHHCFTREDLAVLCEPGLDLVCTEKDAIKLEFEFPEILSKHAIWAIQLEIRFLPGFADGGQGQGFENWWEAAWLRIKTGRLGGRSD